MAKIPEASYAQFDFSADMEVRAFLSQFDEPLDTRVLVIGAHDEPTANILAKTGYRVTGVDFRGYDQTLPPCNYEFVEADFNELAPRWLREGRTFDSVVALSCIEHFGLGTYGERKSPFADVVALRYIWDLLKPMGTAYVTVPIGGCHIEYFPHWRVYSLSSLETRLVQDFSLDFVSCFIAGPVLVGRDIKDMKRKDRGESLALDEIVSYGGHPPHLNAILRMHKEPLAPRRQSIYLEQGLKAGCEFICGGCQKRATGGYVGGAWTGPVGWMVRYDSGEPVLFCSMACHDSKPGNPAMNVSFINYVRR